MSEINKNFFADGEFLTPEQTRKKFLSFSIGERQKKCLDLVPDDSQLVFDLGCYTGLFTDALKRRFPSKQIFAGDYDKSNLEIARYIYPDISDIFEEVNVYDMGYESRFFDCIIFQEVIEHLEGAAHAIKEINRVLKVGGELILSTPTPYYWKDMWQSFKYELVKKYRKKDLPLSDSIYFQEHEWNRHIYCWTPSTLYTLLKVNGFEYVAHAYCQDGRGFFERLMLKILPFLSPTIIMKVKKISEASDKLV